MCVHLSQVVNLSESAHGRYDWHVSADGGSSPVSLSWMVSISHLRENNISDVNARMQAQHHMHARVC